MENAKQINGKTINNNKKNGKKYPKKHKIVEKIYKKNRTVSSN